jgi:hypothetical protein
MENGTFMYLYSKTNFMQIQSVQDKIYEINIRVCKQNIIDYL